MCTSVSADTCEVGQRGGDGGEEREGGGLGDILMTPKRTQLNWPLSLHIHIQQYSLR